MKTVPTSLKTWFKIHFFLDYIFGIPLLLFPSWFLNIVGLNITDEIFPRLVGAALLGIGGMSLFESNAKKHTYQAMLTLKLIWSSTAVIGLIIAQIQTNLKILTPFIVLYFLFFILWSYFKFIKLKE